MTRISYLQYHIEAIDFSRRRGRARQEYWFISHGLHSFVSLVSCESLDADFAR
jgi:hypothetical protein